MPRSLPKTASTSDAWAELYNLESHLPPETDTRDSFTAGRRKPGRPRRAIQRTKKNIELTDGEMAQLVQIQKVLALNLNKVNRGQVAGLAFTLLYEALEKAFGPDLRVASDIRDWHGLIARLRMALEGEGE